MVVRLGWLWLMRLYSRKRPGKHPMLFAGYKTRHMLLATFAGVRGAITLAGVLSIPLLLPDGTPFPGRYLLVFLATGVILFSLVCGIIILPLLLGKNVGIFSDNRQKKRKLPICLWPKWPYSVCKRLSNVCYAPVQKTSTTS